jgi:hypothetical protein
MLENSIYIDGISIGKTMNYSIPALPVILKLRVLMNLTNIIYRPKILRLVTICLIFRLVLK